jgi:hypothetical protein
VEGLVSQEDALLEDLGLLEMLEVGLSDMGKEGHRHQAVQIQEDAT